MSGNNEKRVFVDTNIFLREFAPDDSRLAEEVRSFLKRVAQGEIQAETSTFVCAEVQWVLKRQHNIEKKLRIKTLQGILQLENLSLVTTDDMAAALELYAAHGAKFIDCLLAAYVLSEDTPIVSYDTDFDTLGCERLEPGEVDISGGN